MLYRLVIPACVRRSLYGETVFLNAIHSPLSVILSSLFLSLARLKCNTKLQYVRWGRTAVLFVLSICGLVLFTQKAIKPFSFNIHQPEHYNLLTERYWFVSKPTVMDLFPFSFDFYSVMVFARDVSTLLLRAQQVMMKFGRGGIRELFVVLCNLNLVRRFVKLAFAISRLRLCWRPGCLLQWFWPCFWSCCFCTCLWSSCCYWICCFTTSFFQFFFLWGIVTYTTKPHLMTWKILKHLIRLCIKEN